MESINHWLFWVSSATARQRPENWTSHLNKLTPRELRSAPPVSQAEQGVLRLRVLATTDLHMHLTARDYVSDQCTNNPGFAGVATLIEQARAEAAQLSAGSVLFDNGDLLQGTAIGDWLAQHPVTAQHPAIACLHALNYDALGVGNHDLDYGMPYLRAVAGQLTPPMIASNLASDDLSPLTPAALIRCDIPRPGRRKPRVVHIGVLSVLPRQTAQWNRQMLDGVATVQSAAQSLRKAVPRLRAQGADLIVVLAHMGLDKNNARDDTAVPLAKIPGIDAMIAGHTHRRFPGQDHADAKGVNIHESTVSKVPVVMPGHAGSDLAVLDLSLQEQPDGSLRVKQHHSELRRNSAWTQPAPAVLAATAKVDRALRRHLSEVVGHSPVTLHNFFALVQPTPICTLTAWAKRQIVRTDLQGRPEADLPLVIATSAHTAGGRDGPQNFLHIPKGKILRRHLSGLNPYGNAIWALRVTGAELRHRLEHAARVFGPLDSTKPDQPLHNSRVPMFSFDTFFGLRYDIDPLQPEGSRIVNLTSGGTPVADNQAFLLVTTPFRASGGGGYEPLSDQRVVLRCQTPLEDGLSAVLNGESEVPKPDIPWHLRPGTQLRARFETSPDALAHLDQIDGFAPRIGPTTEAGFTALHLSF